MISRNPTFVHWNYFLAIEEDLDRISRFVDFSGNEDTYSLEIARVLLSACSEIDVFLKLLCKKLNASSSARNINEYKNELNSITTIAPFEVTMPRHQMSTKPWLSWSTANTPEWWSAHNEVKHQRDTEFAQAKLTHCINAVGALYVAALHLYQQEAESGELLQLPKLFNVSDANFNGTQMGRFGHSFKYKF